jgi:hypothetical protein
MEDIEMNLQYFEYKLAAVRNREGIAYQNILRQYNMLKDAWNIYKMLTRKSESGIKMYIKPHNF